MKNEGAFLQCRWKLVKPTKFAMHFFVKKGAIVAIWPDGGAIGTKMHGR